MIRTSTNLLSIGLLAGALTATSSVTAGAQGTSATSATSVAAGRPLAATGSLSDLFRGSPGTGVGTPSAMGAGMGDVFVGGAYISAIRRTKLPSGQWLAGDLHDDGLVAGGFGLGDAVDGIGLQTTVTMMSPYRSGIGTYTSLSMQLFRYLDPTLAIAVGGEDALRSGGGDADGSFYGAVTKVFNTPVPDAAWLKSISVTGGVGNGRFRTLDQIRRDDEVVNPFASVGILVHDQANLIADWTGQDLNVGATIVPFKKFPIALTPMLTELLGRANSSVRFVMGAGIGYHF